MKITEFPEITSIENDNVFLVDGSNGTKKIKGENLPYAVMAITGPEMHRNIFRGKNLGASLTAGQKAAIYDGSFKDIWVGDYWEINDIKWRIVDIDYWYNCGNEAFTTHHVVVMPDIALYDAQMNNSDITTSGYVGSAMYTSHLGNAKTIISSAFGSDNILIHKEYLVNAATNGYPSGGAWLDSKVEIPSEIMMYGNSIFASSGNTSTVTNRYTIDKSQLALFKIHPKFIISETTYWLRDIAFSTSFAAVSNEGNSNCLPASLTAGVRPIFAVG